MNAKRWISVAVSCIMLLTLLPIGAWAAEPDFNAPLVTMTVDGNATTYTFAQTADFVAAFAKVTNAKVKLEADFPLPTGQHLEVQAGQTIELDFNGRKIIKTDNSVNAPIENYGVMTLTDTTSEKLGGISGENRCVNNYNKMTIENGCYSTSNTIGGTAIQNKIEDAVMVINDCAVTAGVFAFFNTGTATINGGTFENYGSCSRCNPNGWAYTAKSVGTLYVNGGEIHGVQGALGISAGYAEIRGGTFHAHACELPTHNGDGSTNAFYALYVAGEQAEVKCVVYDGQFISEGIYAVVLIGNDNTNGDGGINAKATSEIKGGIFTSKLETTPALKGAPITGNPTVTGGTFSSDVSAYIANKTYQKDNQDGTHTVLPSFATIIDTAKTTGAEVTLDNLEKHNAIDHTSDATYKVVTSTAPAVDVAVATGAIAANEADTNSEKAIFDISVLKTDSTGKTEDVSSSITNQKVTLTLAETPVADSTVCVYHINGDTAEKIEDVITEGNTVTFTAPSFSTYAVTFTAGAVDPETITDKVGVVFSPVSDGSNQYYITLKAIDAGKKIHRFMSADLVFKNNGAGIGYDIEPAANMTVSAASENDKSTEYHFEMNGTVASSVTGDEITIGTVTFNGYGTLDFSVDTAYTSAHAVNIVNTAEVADNIVDNYTLEANTLVVNDGEAGTITDVLKPETKALTVNVSFPNAIENNAADYQDMKLTISGGDLSTDKVIKLGTTPNLTNTEASVTFADSAYTAVIADELTQNIAYTVTVEGAGYRTARYTVTMTEDKVLNFWNNAKDSAAEVEEGNTDSKKTVTYLAGDIVKDNNINIYDLSAVVSYFGTITDTNAYSKYAKYDLNRDGKIDSKDVAMVLVSWGE